MSWTTLFGIFVLELLYRISRCTFLSRQWNNDLIISPDGEPSFATEDRAMSLLDYFDTQRPAVKRIKRSDGDSTELLSRENSVSDESLISHRIKSPERSSSENSDLETPPLECSNSVDIGPSGDPAVPLSSQTELEISLPAVKTDQESIEEYEASRVAETEEAVNDEQKEVISIQERIDRRKWRKGRSSIYVDAFNLALETVLDEESHLFSGTELTVFMQWKALPYESQYL